MQRIFREPLVHFAAIGLVVFAGNAIWQSRLQAADETIHISLAQAERLTAIWAGETGRLPEAEDVQALVSEYVREEALYREALKLGLDRDDTIIRRRLVQKMRFMLDDTARIEEPDEATLLAAFEAAPEEYASAARLSFSHVYLSPEVHGDAIDAVARTMLATLQADDRDWRGMGDAFMLPRQFGELSATDVTRLFGQAFSDVLFASEGEGWLGPYGSAFGLHLVRIESRQPGAAAQFGEVRERVREDWLRREREQMNAAALAEIMARYKVEIEGVR